MLDNKHYREIQTSLIFNSLSMIVSFYLCQIVDIQGLDVSIMKFKKFKWIQVIFSLVKQYLSLYFFFGKPCNTYA